MVWLANFNAGPISSQYGSDGNPVPVASDLSIAGHSWNLYSGSNGANAVFSFLPTSGTITSFSGDLKDFFDVSGSYGGFRDGRLIWHWTQYLTENEGLSSSQYLVTAQAGTEATSGSATLDT